MEGMTFEEIMAIQIKPHQEKKRIMNRKSREKMMKRLRGQGNPQEVEWKKQD